MSTAAGDGAGGGGTGSAGGTGGTGGRPGAATRAAQGAAAVAMDLFRKSWFVILILVVWWAVSASGLVDPYKLPAPGDVLSTLGTLFTDRALLDDLGATLLRLVEGWAIGVVAGVLLGILTGGSSFLEDGIRPVIAGLQAVPTIAFLPLAILWFGFNGTAVLAITAFGFTRWLPLALAVLALAGAADNVSAVFRATILQAATPDHFRGRLQGVFTAVVAGGPRLGDLEAGVVAAAFGEAFSVISGGIACAVLAVGLAARRPTFLAYDSRHPVP